MSVIISQSRTVVGCGIETTDAILYYDISNPLCYGGSGTTTNNLVFKNPTYTGSLVNGPAYDATYPQNFSFDGSNDYLTCTEAYLGPSFTAIVVAKSNQSTWSVYNIDPFLSTNIFGGNSNQTVGYPYNFSGFSIYPYSPTSISFVICDEAFGGRGFTTGNITPTNIDVPTFYFLSIKAYPILPGGGGGGLDVKYGYNNNITSYSTNNTRTLTNKMDLFVAADDIGANPLNMTLYSAILYNRALEDWEITQTYQAMKRKYGIPY